MSPSLQLYVYDAADLDEPYLVEELDDLEEAVARCHDLVENDGHARAEAWDAEGDCRYGVALRGGVVRTYGSPRFEQEDAPRAAAVPAPRRPADVLPPPAAPMPLPLPPGVPVAPDDLLLGEKPMAQERWFGM